MAVIVEGDIQITIPDNAIARRFDENSIHGLSHCMKAVDYIFELTDRIVFFECKDPDDPNATIEKQEKFFKDLMSGKIDSDLKTKFRDSFLYEWAYGRTEKPIHFWVLLGAEKLDRSQLLVRTEALKRQLPVKGPQGMPWTNPFVKSCMVMNLAAWNEQLSEFPATRRSA